MSEVFAVHFELSTYEFRVGDNKCKLAMAVVHAWRQIQSLKKKRAHSCEIFKLRSWLGFT